MAHVSASPITSVQPQTGGGHSNGGQASLMPDMEQMTPARLYLNLRGTMIPVDRDALASFPESVLSVMFPHGPVLCPRNVSAPSPTPAATDAPTSSRPSNVSEANSERSAGSQSTDTDHELSRASPTPSVPGAAVPTSDESAPWDMVHVDFHPAMLRYILDFYQRLPGYASQFSQSYSIDSQYDGHSHSFGASVDGYEGYPSTVDMSDASMVTAQTSLSNSREDGLDPAGSPPPADSTVANASTVSSASSTGSEASSFPSAVHMLFANMAHPYFHDKQAVIALREDLDYFTIVKPYVPRDRLASADPKAPPPASTTELGPFSQSELKAICGEVLLDQRQVFSALERNMHNHHQHPQPLNGVEKETDGTSAVASVGGGVEQQLIDMLCVSGFSRAATWGCRVREPQRSTIASLALVRLEPTGEPAQAVAAQKLLLFWKKPARKCWWDGTDVKVNNTVEDIPVRIWCRRMWTLELVLV
ncbi:hypothetical protein IWQ60_001565 [Tieghemiomyces parasiticus]|uniref:Phosphatase activator n=1 Tax=Tieghemiomyces parasiticus TaxID=78921 RepID=A0A9W8E2F2_9FUNG|nr:hypothetical protein IWQ60_001565 [Tieghemiomyces parasiticus]